MSELNRKGPNNEGAKAGRKLGCCVLQKKEKQIQFHLGQGMGKRRRALNENLHKNNL